MTENNSPSPTRQRPETDVTAAPAIVDAHPKAHQLRSDDRGITGPLDASILIAVSLIAFLSLAGVVFGAVVVTQDTVTTEAVSGELAGVSSAIEQIATTDTNSKQVDIQIDELRQGDLSGGGQADELGNGQIISTRSSDDPTVSLQIDGTSQSEQLTLVSASSPTTTGQIQFKDGQQRVSYQNGAIFRQQTNGAVTVVTAPTFGVSERGNEKAVSFPVRAVQPDDGTVETLGGGLRVERSESVDLYEDVYVSPSESITYTVTSEYADGWEQIFRTRFDGKSWATVTRVDGTTVRVEMPAADRSTGVYVTATYTLVNVTG